MLYTLHCIQWNWGNVQAAVCCQSSLLLSASWSIVLCMALTYVAVFTPASWRQTPSFAGCVCGMCVPVTSLFKLVTLPIVHRLLPAPGFYLSEHKLTWYCFSLFWQFLPSTLFHYFQAYRDSSHNFCHWEFNFLFVSSATFKDGKNIFEIVLT